MDWLGADLAAVVETMGELRRLLDDARMKQRVHRSADQALQRARQAAEDRTGPEQQEARRRLNAASRDADQAGTAADQAWEAWTTREGIRSFFAPDALVEPRVGGAFHIHMDPGGAPGMKGADEMRFMALQPKKMLSFDWNAPPHLPEARAQRKPPAEKAPQDRAP